MVLQTPKILSTHSWKTLSMNHHNVLHRGRHRLQPGDCTCNQKQKETQNKKPKSTQPKNTLSISIKSARYTSWVLLNCAQNYPQKNRIQQKKKQTAANKHEALAKTEVPTRIMRFSGLGAHFMRLSNSENRDSLGTSSSCAAAAMITSGSCTPKVRSR